MNATKKAGAVILKTGDPICVALLYRHKQRDWSFPKGHVEPGENAPEAMKREVFEETGLRVDIIDTLPDLVYVGSDGKKVRTKMYLVGSLNDNFRLESEGDIMEWIALDDVERKLSYENLKKYFSEIKQIITKSQ